ncbi:hypothetical protein SNEBB_000248 [Seison nebaliae]|nr:hypothetical protein SNEBB_000248 [Seison nebaliae]
MELKEETERIPIMDPNGNSIMDEIPLVTTSNLNRKTNLKHKCYGTMFSNRKNERINELNPLHTKLLKHTVTTQTTLQGIALKYDVDISLIKRLNRIKDNLQLKVMPQIVIPLSPRQLEEYLNRISPQERNIITVIDMNEYREELKSNKRSTIDQQSEVKSESFDYRNYLKRYDVENQKKNNLHKNLTNDNFLDNSFDNSTRWLTPLTHQSNGNIANSLQFKNIFIRRSRTDDQIDFTYVIGIYATTMKMTMTIGVSINSWNDQG